MKTSDYLNQLVKDTNQLKANLVEMGAEVTEDDNLTTCVPKVLDLSSDLPTKVYIQLYELPEAIEGNRKLHSFMYDDYEVSRVDALLEKLGGEIDG